MVLMLRQSLALLLVSTATTTSAHFPWLHVTEDATPRLHFGESLAERDYHLPKAVEAAEVWQDAIDAPAKRLAMDALEEEGFVGIECEESIEPRGVVRTKVVYGNYHGSLLTYYAQHFPAENPSAWPTNAISGEGIEACLRIEGDELLVEMMLDREPLAEANASLTNEEGGEGLKAQTDVEGVARFEAAELIDGLNGVMVMHVDPEAAGEIDGEQHESTTLILTATFNYSSKAAAKVSALPSVPEAVASFGAVVTDGWLYVYGGHIGKAHDHSRDNLSKHFRRIKLDGSGGWEELPMGTPLQGLPLVAHGGKLYRVGGLDAHNPTGEEEDLHSVDQFAVFDPESGAWSELPSLPGPRSSHNAVVIGDTLYVVGGWALSGSSDGDWQSGALAIDLASSDAQWRELPEPPFKRRALAISHLDGRVAVLCGMTDEADLSKQVFFYDPAEETWSEGPEFPGRAFHGFGLSAWNLDGVLYAGGMEGVLYRLNETGEEWVKVTELTTRRFFHQLVPDGTGNLLAVAGASPEEGHTGSIERLSVEGEEETTEPAEETALADPEAVDEAQKTTQWVDPRESPPDRWPGFRGVGTSVTAATNLPLNWSDEEGVAWRADLPGYGQSSPVVWGGRVFVTTMQGDEKETPTVLCFDLKTGEELWRREFESSQRVEANNFVSRSAPTPCLDEHGVYAWFESGDLFALDHNGKLLWQRSIVDEFGAIEGNHGIGGSPLLSGSTLIVPMLHAGPSYLLAVDTSTGATLWKTDSEPRIAWSSPSLTEDRVLVSGAGSVEAYDVATGERLWQVDSFEGNNVPSPSVAGDLIVIGSQERSSNAAIITEQDAAEIAWRGEKATSSFASPLLYGGKAYFVSKAGVAFCVDAATGKLIWKERLSDSCWASPLASGDRVYFFCKDGETAVYSAGSSEQIGDGSLTISDGSRVYGVAAVASNLLLRAGAILICLR